MTPTCMGLADEAPRTDWQAVYFASILNVIARELSRVVVLSARDMKTTGQAVPQSTPPNGNRPCT